jgi:hypothetical protein
MMKRILGSVLLAGTIALSPVGAFALSQNYTGWYCNGSGGSCATVTTTWACGSNGDGTVMMCQYTKIVCG